MEKELSQEAERELALEEEFVNPFANPTTPLTPEQERERDYVPAAPLSFEHTASPGLPSSAPIFHDTPFTLPPPSPRKSTKLTKKEKRRLAGPAGPRSGPRELRVLYRREEIGSEVVDFILAQWKKSRPLHAMMTEANKRQLSSGKPLLSLVDLYGILYHAFTQKEITQRREPSNEMPLAAFVDFVKEWRKGSNYAKCCEGVLPYRNTYFLQRVHRAISIRYRSENVVVRTAAEKERIQATAYKLERTVLRHGSRLVLEGVAGVFIPLAKLPHYCLEILQAIPKLKDIYTLNATVPTPDATPEPTTEPLEEPLVPAIPKLDLKTTFPPVLSPPPEVPSEVAGPSEFDSLELDDLIFGDDEAEEEDEESKEPAHDPFAPPTEQTVSPPEA